MMRNLSGILLRARKSLEFSHGLDPYATSRGVSGFKRRAASGSALSTRTCPLSPELSGVRQPFNRCELIRLGELILHLFPQVPRENRNNMRLRQLPELNSVAGTEVDFPGLTTRRGA